MCVEFQVMGWGGFTLADVLWRAEVLLHGRQRVKEAFGVVDHMNLRKNSGPVVLEIPASVSMTFWIFKPHILKYLILHGKSI